MNDFRRFDAGQAFLAGRAARDERILKSRLAGLASQAYGADPSAQDGLVQQAIALDPQAGYAIGAQAQQATQGREQRVGRLAVILSQAPDSLRPQLRRQMLPELRRMGIDIKDEEDEAERQIVQQLAALYGGGGQGKPAAMQVFEAQAAAAGLKPGTPEYQKAAQIALGLQGRASSAGMSFDTVDDNGVPRPQRRDPRSGSVEMYIAEQSRWVPLGGGQPQGAPPQTAPPAQRPPANNGGDPQMTALANAANAMIAAGIPPEQVDAFLMQTAQASPNVQVQPPGMVETSAPPQRLPSINDIGGGAYVPPIGRGRTKEQEAAAVEAARIAAQQAAAPRQAELDAQREGAVTQARETASAGAKKAADLPNTIAKADQTIALLDKAINHPGRSTATGLSGSIDPRNYLPGTEATNFRVVMDQLGGQAFLQAFESLKGGGQITEVEGKKATDAMARLNTAQSDAEFVLALEELRDLARLAKDRAIRGVTVGQPSEQAQSQPSRIRYDAQGNRI